MATSPPANGSQLSTASILSVTRTTKTAKGVAGSLHKLKAAAASAVAATPSSSAGTTILRLGKSATTLAINGAGGNKVEAAPNSTATSVGAAATTTSNKLSSAVTSEPANNQTPQSTTTQTNVPLGNGKSRGFCRPEYQMRRINSQGLVPAGVSLILLQMQLAGCRLPVAVGICIGAWETKPDAVSWRKISRLLFAGLKLISILVFSFNGRRLLVSLICQALDVAGRGMTSNYSIKSRSIFNAPSGFRLHSAVNGYCSHPSIDFHAQFEVSSLVASVLLPSQAKTNTQHGSVAGGLH